MLRIGTSAKRQLRPADLKAAWCEGLCWLDLERPDEAELAAVARMTGASAGLLESAADTQTTVRAEATDGWLLLVTRAPDLSDEGMRTQHLGLLVSEHVLISIREAPLSELDDVSHDWEVEQLASGPDILHSLLDAVLDGLFPRLDTIEDRLYEVEESIIEGQLDQHVIQSILRTGRELLIIRKIGSALRETANTILRRTSQKDERWACFQEIYDHASRIVDMAETLHEIASNSIDANMAAVSNQLNSVMKTLTIFATVLMTVSMFAGIFGMNFAFPWLVKEQTLRGFWITMGLSGATIAALLLWFRKMRYIG